MVFWHLPELTVGIAVDDMEYEVSDDGDTRAFGNCDGATVALAADYEIFAPTLTGAPRVNYYAVERFDYKNKQLYHCITFVDTETKKLTGQCTERPGFPQKPAVEGRMCRERCRQCL